MGRKPWTTYWVFTGPAAVAAAAIRHNVKHAPPFTAATEARLRELLAPVAHLAVESALARLAALPPIIDSRHGEPVRRYWTAPQPPWKRP